LVVVSYPLVKIIETILLLLHSKSIEMNKFFFFTLSLVLLISSCKEEIDPSLDGKTTAIVYGLLDQNDTIHYVKITRAFSGTGNANDIALIPDSSYFKTVEGSIKEYQNGVLKRTWDLKDTLIKNKESGTFYGPDQKVYYFKTLKTNPLVADGLTEYRFEAKLDKGLSSECIVKGQTKLISDFKINDPKSQVNAGNFKFAQDNAQVNGYNITRVRIGVGTAKKVEAKLIIEFEEYINTSVTTKKFEWFLGSADETVLNDGVVEFPASGETFFQLISQNVTVNPNITKRILKSMTLVASAADEDLQKYILLNKPSSSLTQNKPIYTNLNITNNMRVIGIFAARNTVQNYYYKWIFNAGTSYTRCIDVNSMKELYSGKYTGGLNFCSDLPADLNQNFYCN
jgi:hypothetical protein